jgi:transcriptional regulator with XRE-family HTH domain
MGLYYSVNDEIRKKIKTVRIARKLTMREVADRAGIPVSSYAAMEAGRYKLNVDNLFLILGALESDIHEVWPSEGLAEQLTGKKLFLVRQQEFRLQELLELSGSAGGALLAQTKGVCSVLLKWGVSDYLLDRVALYLEENLKLERGIFFSRERGETTYHLFLSSEDVSVKPWLVERYLTIWAAVFSDSFAFETAKKRQLQAR